MIARLGLQIWTRILMELSMLQLFRGTRLSGWGYRYGPGYSWNWACYSSSEGHDCQVGATDMDLDTHGLEHDTALQRDMIARLVLQIWTRVLMELSMIHIFRGTWLPWVGAKYILTQIDLSLIEHFKGTWLPGRSTDTSLLDSNGLIINSTVLQRYIIARLGL
jgi:hypothetical protein